MKRHIVLDKKVGETPLSCMESWRITQSPFYNDMPLAYAGRLDPLASGKLLVLIGEECKRQEQYHKLDKRYEFSILCGVSSDTGDVMGRLKIGINPPSLEKFGFKKILKNFIGTLSLPFPIFSARTVKGKPLHTWAMENRLNEIIIPTQISTIYNLSLTRIEILDRQTVYEKALTAINSIPTVNEERKALGNDFRRTDIRSDWLIFLKTGKLDDKFFIAHCQAIVSSGTYIRSLAPIIGKAIGAESLAFHIHRTHIGQYQPLGKNYGWWRKKF